MKFALASAWLAVLAAQTSPRPIEALKAPVALTSPVQDKNFYLLSTLERTAAVRQAIKSDAALARLAEAKRASLGRAVETCNMDLQCYAAAMRWTDSESSAAAQAMRALSHRSEPLKRMIDGPLRASGMFQRLHERSGEELVAQAWLDAARGINQIIDVYGTGRSGRYPAADAVTYDVSSDAYRNMVRLLASVVNDQRSEFDLFFQPSLRFAMLLLEINARDEAGRLEPLDTGENAAAIRRIPSLDWSRYPYTVIVVLGSGADRPGVNLSPAGKLRTIVAAKRFRDGKAPLLLVSGGYVHPIQTPFAEAVEMKKYLIRELGVPADAILIDPHARHTTTNLRNAARQIYRYGIPFDRMALMTTDPGHSSSIESPAFAERCLRELGYLPYELGKRISPFDLEFKPCLDSLQADAMDPLDP
ncbi:MAG: YdcF family protein [Thermoanaerobaculia bacterium]